jgi:hypothetical protein
VEGRGEEEAGLTKREIVEELRFVRDGIRTLSIEEIQSRLDRAIPGIEALPEPGAYTDLDLSEWRPGSSQIAFVPGDCLISLKAVIKAGARIIIEPGKPED